MIRANHFPQVDLLELFHLAAELRVNWRVTGNYSLRNIRVTTS
jgi:hypothetical protein